jgi:hypothetical protein
MAYPNLAGDDDLTIIRPFDRLDCRNRMQSGDNVAKICNIGLLIASWTELSMSAKAWMVVAVICLAEAALAGSRSLARGGGFHGDGISAGHGGRMDGFSMHGRAMGSHERDKYGHRDDQRDRSEHRHDQRYVHRDDHQWHRDDDFGDRGHDGPHPEGAWSRGSGFGDRGHDGSHPEGTWSRGSGFGNINRGQTTANGQWHVGN